MTTDQLKSLRRTLSHFGLTIWLSAHKVAPDAVAYVRAVVDGRELAEQSVPLRVLPPLPDGPRSPRFGNLFAGRSFGKCPSSSGPTCTP